MADGHRAKVVEKVREGLALMRPRLVAARITQAEMEAAGSVADAFVQMARSFREVAAEKSGPSRDALRSDAEALALLTALCLQESVTWDDVRGVLS